MLRCNTDCSSMYDQRAGAPRVSVQVSEPDHHDARRRRECVDLRKRVGVVVGRWVGVVWAQATEVRALLSTRGYLLATARPGWPLADTQARH